jgi:hypothetical protein
MSPTDELRLKASLLVEGMSYGPGALEGVGTKFKEQNHGLFGWDFVNHVDVAMPDDFVLSSGLVSQFRYNPDSRYRLERVDDALAVTKDGDVLDRPRLIPRPAYYERKTTAGNAMRSVAQTGGEDCFFVCYQNYCSHFAEKTQCAFCNLVATKRTYESVLPRKDLADIGECAASAFAEGDVQHILLTGGCFNHEKEVELVCSIVKEISTSLGKPAVPGTVLPSATLNEADIARYRETGIGAIGYSMEIWDEQFYKAICPGKSKGVSHDQFVEAIRTAVKVFGAGNVYGVLVMGIEPRDSFLDGVRILYDIGANVVPFVWSPNPGSRFEGHRAPSANWYVEATLEAADIVASSGVPRGEENHCFRCDGNSLLHDALRATEAAPAT